MIREPFQGLTDPRQARAQWPNLLNIVALPLGAAIGGADNGGGNRRVRPGQGRRSAGIFALPNGIPAHYTLGQGFSRRDPEQFQAGFRYGAPPISPRPPRDKESPLTVKLGAAAATGWRGGGRCLGSGPGPQSIG